MDKPKLVYFLFQVGRGKKKKKRVLFLHLLLGVTAEEPAS